MKKILKIIIFISLFLIIFFLVNKLFHLENNSITQFYTEPKNSLDTVYIGASNAYAQFNTTLAYHEYGFTTGMLSTDSMPIIPIKYLIEEARKYQNPKVYIIDLARVTEDFSDIEEGGIRKTIDAIPNSINRFNCVKEILSYTNIPKSEYINYYFSFLKYHSLWETKNIFEYYTFEQLGLYKGYLFNSYTINIEKQTPYIWSDEITSLDDNNQKVIEDLLKYIKDNKIEVLFIIPKRIFKENEIPMINYAIKLIRDNGFQVINFNTLDDFDVDFDTDLYNFAHLNVYGATKYTLYFSNYLKNHYDLDDHRGDKKYESWDMEYERFKKDYKALIKSEFDDLLQEYYYQ